MRPSATLFAVIAALLLAACSGGGSDADRPRVIDSPIVVDTRLDDDAAAAGSMTLRQALATARSGQTIEFAPELDGRTIELNIVGQTNTVLKGEVMGIRNEPSGPVSYLEGYFDRDYGRSALYARKDVVIDASNLPSGVTIAWTGGAADPARVLAVYGDLTLRSVAITGGVNVAEDISTADPDAQPWTLARGGGIAVWGLGHACPTVRSSTITSKVISILPVIAAPLAAVFMPTSLISSAV